MSLGPITAAAAGLARLAVPDTLATPAALPDKGSQFAQLLPSAPDGGVAKAGAPVLTEVQAPRTDTLGSQVLNSLERYGHRVRELERLGQSARGRGALQPGPAAAPLRPVSEARSLAPDAGPVKASADGGPKAPLEEQYAQIFEDSMARQAKLFDLVINVDLGRTVASTSTSTAKTLLTQSG